MFDCPPSLITHTALQPICHPRESPTTVLMLQRMPDVKMHQGQPPTPCSIDHCSRTLSLCPLSPGQPISAANIILSHLHHVRPPCPLRMRAEALLSTRRLNQRHCPLTVANEVTFLWALYLLWPAKCHLRRAGDRHKLQSL